MPLLRNCLESLERQIAAFDDFEVVVVDNGSTDETADYLAEWAAVSPLRCRVVVEPCVGLSHARNAGVAVARGQVVLFIDDDAIAPQGWVAAHLRAYGVDPSLDAVEDRSC